MNMQSMEIWQALRDYWTSLEVARWVESRFFLRRHHQLKSYGQASAGYPIALNTNGEIDTSFMPDALLRDGSRTLTADWDIGDTRRVRADGVKARDGAGLRLEDDAGNLGVFVEDGGQVGIGTTSPAVALDVVGAITASGVITGNGSGLTTLNASNISSGTLADARFTNALLRDGSRSLTADWDIGDNRRIKADGLRARDGAGLRLEDDAGNLGVFVEDGGQVGIGTAGPQAPLHVIAASNADNEPFQEWSYTDFSKDQYSLTLKQTVTSGVVRYNFSMVNNYVAYDNVLVLDRGNVGIGTTSPLGALHVKDGDGYYLVKYVSPINSATPIVVIPNGAGDVTKIIQFNFVVTDGTNSTASTGSRTPGGAVVDATLGTNTFRMTVNADGSVDVRRQAGTGTLSAMLDLKWI